MRTVRLPIYDEAGDQMLQYLEVDVTFFISSVRGIRSSQCRVVDLPTPEQEKEMIDRIIHDLPTMPFVPGPWNPREEPTDLTADEARSKGFIKRSDERTPVTYKSQLIDIKLAAQLRAKEERRLGEAEVILVDAVSPHPDIRHTYGDWRRIPGFEGYSMNPRKIIIDEATDQTVGQEMGGTGAKVNLFDGTAGRRKSMSVDFLFKKTFPELKK